MGFGNLRTLLNLGWLLDYPNLPLALLQASCCSNSPTNNQQLKPEPKLKTLNLNVELSSLTLDPVTVRSTGSS